MEEQISEVDSLKQEIAKLCGAVQERNNTIAALEKTLKEKDGEIDAAKQLVDKTNTDAAGIAGSLRQAVAAYQELAKEANPGIVGEMIKGDTVAAIQESVQSAKALVEKVQEEMRTNSARLRVPAGAPQRNPPDLSGMSSLEKIKYGMEV